MDHDETGIQFAPTNLGAIWVRVQTARLLLRRLQLTDGPAMFQVHGDPATYHYSPAALHPDLATSEEMLRSCLHHWETYGFGYWAVTPAQQETIVGFGGLEYRHWRDRDALNLYYRFTPSAWGQGYATELAQRAVSMAREHLPKFPVIARTRPANLASQQVAQKVGLLRLPEQESEGEYVVFALGWE
ncbi:MAG: GNAT family N-acetyltransferase [Ktedonobacteraceae bacterium]